MVVLPVLILQDYAKLISSTKVHHQIMLQKLKLLGKQLENNLIMF